MFMKTKNNGNIQNKKGCVINLIIKHIPGQLQIQRTIQKLILCYQARETLKRKCLNIIDLPREITDSNYFQRLFCDIPNC